MEQKNRGELNGARMSSIESPSRSLRDLATDLFGELTEAEQTLLAESERKDAVVSPTTSAPIVSWSAASGGTTIPEVRSEILRWMCSADEVAKRVSRKGIRLRAVLVKGRLDLEGVVQPGIGLSLTKCQLVDGVLLNFASLAFLRLEGCTVGSLDADYLVTRGSVRLSDGFRCQGHVYLRGAKIGGNLHCGDARIETTLPEKVALDAELSTISGVVSLGDGFRAVGMVSFFCARIEKRLVCDGGVFVASRCRDPSIPLKRGWTTRTDEVAFNLEGAEIQGDMVMRRSGMWDARPERATTSSVRHSRVRGQIRIFRTVIRGSLEFDAARISCVSAPPLLIENCQVDKAVHLRNGFWAAGGVRLRATTIGGALDLSRARLWGRDGEALHAPYVRVGLACGLDGLRAQGALNFEFAQIGANFGTAQGCRVEGGVNLYGATIQGSLSLSGSIVTSNRSGYPAVNLERSVIAGNVLLRGVPTAANSRGASNPHGFRQKNGVRLFVAVGAVKMLGAKIGGDLDFSGAQLLGGFQTAVNLRSVQIGRNVFFTPTTPPVAPLIPCRSFGCVDVQQATIGGDLTCSGAILLNSKGESLDLRWAKVAGVTRFDRSEATEGRHTKFRTSGGLRLDNANLGKIVDDRECWPSREKLVLDGLSYNAISQIDIQTRIVWLERQKHSGRVSLQPYEKLALILRQSGHEEDARKVAIAKQNAYGKTLPWGRRQLHKVYGATIRYGYRPHFCAIYAPFFIAFAYFTFSNGGAELMRPTKEQAQQQWAEHRTRPKGYPEFAGNQLDYALYAIESFIPGTNFKVREYWEADESATCTPDSWTTKCGLALKIYLAFHALIGAVISALVAAGLAGITRRSI